MALEILSVNAAEIRVRVSAIDPMRMADYTVDRSDVGSAGAIKARGPDGVNITIGSFRSRDGLTLQPDYARLRKLLARKA